MNYQLYDIKPVSQTLKPGLNFTELPEVPVGMRRYVLYIRFKNGSNMRNIIEIKEIKSIIPEPPIVLETVNDLLTEPLEPHETSEIPKAPQEKYSQIDVRKNPFCLFSYSYENMIVIKATAACNLFMNFIDW